MSRICPRWSAVQAGRILCVLVAIAAVAPAAVASPSDLDAVRRLIETNPDMAAYRAAAGSLCAPFELLAGRGLPLSLLTPVLREGAAKGVSPAVLERVLQTEAHRLIEADAILEATAGGGSAAGSPSAVSAESLRRLSLILQGGIDRATIGSILSAAGSIGRGLSFGETLLAILQVGQLDARQMVELARSAYDGGLPETAYRALPSLFVRARLRGLTMSETASLVDRLLARGYGVIQIEAEIREQARMR